jgi:hypothetical protein
VVGRVNLNTVADEVATALATISGLRVHDHPPANVVPPAGIVSFPDRVEFDATYGRGMDRIQDWPVLVVVGKATDRTARTRIYGYAAATGSSSVKAVLEAHTWTSLSTLRVASVEFDVVTIASVDYISALFHLDIAGQGTT